MDSDLNINWPEQSRAPSRPGLKYTARQKAAIRMAMLKQFDAFLEKNNGQVDESMRQKVKDELQRLRR